MKKYLNNIKENLNKNKKTVLIFSLIWIVICVLTLTSYKNTLGKEAIGSNSYHYIEVLDNDKQIVQIVDAADGVDSISIRLEVFKKDNSLINIEVIGKDSNKVYGQKSYKAKDVLGASFNTFALDEKVDSSVDKQILIKIGFEGNDGSLGVWCANSTDNGTLLIDGEETETNITYKQLRANETYNSFNITMIVITIFVVSLLIFVLFVFDPKMEIIFTMIVLLIGLIFIVIITPISGPDEEYHYRQALVLSNKILGKENPNEIEDVYVGYYDFVADYNVGEGYKNIVEKLNIELPTLDGRRMLSINDAVVYSYQLCYLPQALGITIARIFKFNFLNTYYLGRFFSLLFYVACIYLAIKKTPILKVLFGITATLPIFLQQAICYSQDMFICGLSILVFAILLNWIYRDNKITKKDFVFALIVDALLAPAKVVYSLFMLLYIFVPANKYYSKKHKIICTLILLIPTFYEVGGNILSRIIPILMTVVYAEGSDNTIVLNECYSIRYIVANPVKTIILVLNTLRLYLKSWFAAATGRYLSGLTLIIPSKLSYTFVAMLLVSSLVREDSIIPVLFKLCIIIVCIGIGCFVLATMLVGWTEIGSEVIQGIQGRYFSPLLVYIFTIFNNKKIAISNRFNNYLIYAQILILFEVIIYILSYTFVF